jgi:hypothetical protein
MRSLFFVLFVFYSISSLAQGNSNSAFLKHQATEDAYNMAYKGLSIEFYEPLNIDQRRYVNWSAYMRRNKIKYNVPYKIVNFWQSGHTSYYEIKVIEKNNPKAREIRLGFYNNPNNEYGIERIPIFIIDNRNAGCEEYINYVGKKVLFGNREYIIKDVVNRLNRLTVSMTSQFVYVGINTNDTIFEDVWRALSGNYHTELFQVEKPSNDSIRYGETRVITNDSITQYSYIDNMIELVILGNEKEFNFELKNLSNNSIKVIWNEAVFVGIDGVTSKIMHSGIKFSEKEGDQPASVIIRGAKISDVAVPTNNIRYISNGKWVTDSMYPKKENESGQVRLMLPIQIKETINEYVFTFNVKFEWNRPELH